MEKSIYSDEYVIFLRLLQEARREAGYTQRDIAGRLGSGVTQSFVSKCERGERRIDIVELRAFCIAFNIQFEEFVGNLEDRLRAELPHIQCVASDVATARAAAPINDGREDGHKDGHRDGHETHAVAADEIKLHGHRNLPNGDGQEGWVSKLLNKETRKRR